MRKQCPQCARYMAFPEKQVCSVCEWDNETKNRKHDFNFITIDTVSFQVSKNVSMNRVNRLKQQCLAPHGNGEVVYKEKGKITDKEAVL